MAGKSAKIALTYFITILVTLLLIGGLCVYLLGDIMNPDTVNTPSVELDQMGNGSSYVPTVNDNRTTLFIYESQKKMTGTCFMLVRLVASEQKLVLVPIPADTCADLDGSENSIYEFYRT